MNFQEIALFWRMLVIQWQDGEVPLDLSIIAKSLRVEPQEIEKSWETVRKCFTETKTGLVNERLAFEREKAMEKLKRSRKAGKEAANARWEKEKAKKEPLPKPEEFGDASFGMSVDSIVGHYPANDGAGVIPSYVIPTKEEVQEKIIRINRRKEQILNGELDHEIGIDED